MDLAVITNTGHRSAKTIPLRGNSDSLARKIKFPRKENKKAYPQTNISQYQICWYAYNSKTIIKSYKFIKV